MSCRGSIDLGIIACPEAVGDPWHIANGFRRAVDELQLAAEGMPRLDAAPNDESGVAAR